MGTQTSRQSSGRVVVLMAGMAQWDMSALSSITSKAQLFDIKKHCCQMCEYLQNHHHLWARIDILDTV